jgi:hypothetical protein
MGNKGFAVFTILFLILAWNSWKNDKIKDERLVSYTSSTPATASRPSAVATAARPNTNDSQHANITATLRIVAEKWKKTDVNGDGLHNCIDAAVLFYKYFPDKDKVCIMINVNPKTGMNHLFNCVFTEGVWKAIEPQSYANNYSNYLMWAVWGSQFDKSYNRDVTERWKVYAR